MLIGVVVWQLWQHPAVAILLLFTLLALTWLTLGAVIAPAFELMSILFGRHYGTVSGWQFSVNRITGVVGGLMATWLLSAWAWPTNFTLVFITGGTFMILGNTLILLVDEPATPPRTSFQSLRTYTRALTDQVVRHRDFMRLLIVAALTGLFQSVLNFYSVYAFDAVALPLAAAGLLAAVGFIASACGALLGGSLGDRRGHRFLMRTALIGFVISLLLLLPAWQPAFFTAWMLGNAALMTMMIARINLAMDFAPAGDKGTYSMVVFLVAQPMLGLFAVGGGALIDLAGYLPYFIVTLTLALVALGITFFFKDPRLASDFRKGLNNSVQMWRYWCVQDCGGVLGCVLAFGRGCFARVSALLGAFFAPTRVLGALLPCHAANWRAAVTTLVSPSSKASRCLFLARPR